MVAYSIALVIIEAIVFFLVLYAVIKAAVKRGIQETKEEMEASLYRVLESMLDKYKSEQNVIASDRREAEMHIFDSGEKEDRNSRVSRSDS